jgi:hypothetical protein
MFFLLASNEACESYMMGRQKRRCLSALQGIRKGLMLGSLVSSDMCLSVI